MVAARSHHFKKYTPEAILRLRLHYLSNSHQNTKSGVIFFWDIESQAFLRSKNTFSFALGIVVFLEMLP